MIRSSSSRSFIVTAWARSCGPLVSSRGLRARVTFLGLWVCGIDERSEESDAEAYGPVVGPEIPLELGAADEPDGGSRFVLEAAQAGSAMRAMRAARTMRTLPASRPELPETIRAWYDGRPR